MSLLKRRSKSVESSAKPLWLRVGGWVAVVLLVGTFVRPFFQMLIPTRIEIGPETTVSGGPLTPDGRVDYVAAMNQRLSEGVTPENNAAVPLVRAFGPEIIDAPLRPQYFQRLGIEPLPADGDYVVGSRAFFERKNDPKGQNFGKLRDAFDEQLSEAQSRPWSPDEFPEVAEWLEANAAPLEIVVEAITRPRFYSPLVVTPDSPQLLTASLPLEQAAREAGRLLTTRAMLHIHRGDNDAAWSDLLACHRLARLLGQSGPMIGQLVAHAVHSIACAGDEALRRHGQLTADQARRCLADLDGLEHLPRFVDALDTAERYALLDAIQSMFPDKSGLDWNLMLRMANQHLDSLVDALGQQRYANRLRRVEEIEKGLQQELEEAREPLNLITGFVVDRRGMVSRTIGLVHLGLFTPALSAAHTAEVRSSARLHLTRLGFALAAWHADHGAYPESLDKLVPDELADIPLDPFTNAPFRYERTEGGYRLYSVGDNMADDNGRTYGSEPRGDDILIEMPPTGDGAEKHP